LLRTVEALAPWTPTHVHFSQKWQLLGDWCPFARACPAFGPAANARVGAPMQLVLVYPHGIICRARCNVTLSTVSFCTCSAASSPRPSVHLGWAQVNTGQPRQEALYSCIRPYCRQHAVPATQGALSAKTLVLTSTGPGSYSCQPHVPARVTPLTASDSPVSGTCTCYAA
jgi:hypothetical protein